MLTWKGICEILIVISLLFFMIPVKIENPANKSKTLFDEYIDKFNKTYKSDPEEYNKRYEIFKQSLSRIDEYNKNRDHNHTARYGLTLFSDLTENEFYSKHLDKMRKKTGRKHHSKKWNGKHSDDSVEQMDHNRLRREAIDQGLPLKVDWREKGIISPVISQGYCGSCWAISTVHTMEAMHRKTHNNTLLSIQQVVDCARNGNFGCEGGDICNLLQWLTKFKVGVMNAKDYPYTGATDMCHWKKSKNSTGVQIKDYFCDSMVNDENKLLHWLAENGPAAVGVNAITWQDYLGGVIQYHCNNDPLALNHAIQIVGYDLTAPIPYYIGKNSWGTHFGNKGYVYLAIGTNICGMSNEVSMLTVV